jgi:hypothetical protein
VTYSFFSVGALMVWGLVPFFPLPLTSCQDIRSSLSSLLLLSSVSEKPAIGVIALIVVAACDACTLLWTVAAYMKFLVISVVHMKLGMMHVVYMRPFVELLVHIVNICFVTLPFADCSPYHSLSLMIIHHQAMHSC